MKFSSLALKLSGFAVKPPSMKRLNKVEQTNSSRINSLYTLKINSSVFFINSKQKEYLNSLQQRCERTEILHNIKISDIVFLKVDNISSGKLDVRHSYSYTSKYR